MKVFKNSLFDNIKRTKMSPQVSVPFPLGLVSRRGMEGRVVSFRGAWSAWGAKGIFWPCCRCSSHEVTPKLVAVSSGKVCVFPRSEAHPGGEDFCCLMMLQCL